MSANEERLYKRYRSQRKEAQTELSGYQDTNQRLQYQVDRLNQVKRMVTEQKLNFRPIWGAVSKIIDDSYVWIGAGFHRKCKFEQISKPDSRCGNRHTKW